MTNEIFTEEDEANACVWAASLDPKYQNREQERARCLLAMIVKRDLQIGEMLKTQQELGGLRERVHDLEKERDAAVDKVRKAWWEIFQEDLDINNLTTEKLIKAQARLRAYESATPDSPEVKEAIGLGDLCRRHLAGESGAWVGGGYLDKHGRQALDILARALRAAQVKIEAKDKIIESCGQWDGKKTCSVADAVQAKLASAVELLREAIDCPFESDPAKWTAWCDQWRPKAEAVIKDAL